MYGYIYKTTNLVNGKIYIGQKKSNVFLGDKYLGSGKILKMAIEKYGKENFSVELLHESLNKLDLDAMEKYTFKSNEDGDLYVIIKTSDVSGVKSQMNDYFEKVEKFNTNYSPERLEILNNRVSTQVNDYLIYIVSSEATELYDQMISEM